MKFKVLMTCGLLFLSFFFAKAQYSNLVIGPELNFPAGNSSNISGVGAGAYLKAELAVASRFAITANGSMLGFIGKKHFGPRTSNLYYLPVKAGLKYYTSEDFYIEGQLGASFPMNGLTKTTFIWSPGIGALIKRRDSKNLLDFGLRYEGWINSNLFAKTVPQNTTFSFFSLRAGYAFSL